MIRLLRFLIFGDMHLHKWKFKEKIEEAKYGTSAVKRIIYI